MTHHFDAFGMAFPPFPPLHPVLVHIPIVLLPLAALFATLSLQWKKDWAWPATRLTLILGSLGAIAALIAGTLLKAAQAADNVPGKPSDFLATHQLLGFLTTVFAVVLAALLLWKKDALRTSRLGRVWAFSLWLVTLLVIVAAFYGGSMVWEPSP